tara:strand:- start:4232 stop:6412 length:2181 start_codon:yes stop_codon:yes gene_type:complete
MADKKISQMTAMTSGQIASNDNIVIADTSENHTKRAEISELASFFGINPEGQRDTVGAMFNAGTHSGVTVTYDDPNDNISIVLNGSVTDAELGHLNGVTSDIQTQFNGKAGLSSPAFTGNPTAPTQSANDNSTKLANTQYVQSELTAYASDTATFTNKSGDISQWTNDSGYVTPSSTSTFTNKSGSISQWTNNSGYITATSSDTLNNKTISGSNNTISNVPYSAISGFVDTDITSVSGSDDTVASAKAIKTYVDSQITGINELSEATDANISSPSAGQILVYDGTNSWDNQTTTVALTGAVTGTANMNASGDVSVATTIASPTITINGVACTLGSSATIPSVLSGGGTFTGEVHLNDNVKLSLGGASGSGDLQIYHDTNHSYIQDTGTGYLRILGSDMRISNADNTKDYMTMTDGGAVKIANNGIVKVETNATGIDVSGNIILDGTVDGRDVATDGTKLDGISAGAEVNVNADWNSSSGDSQILNKPSLSTVATSGSYADLSNKPTIPTNNNQLTNGAGYITSATDNTKLPLAGGTLTGDLAFGDSIQAKFGASEDLKIFHDGNHSYIRDSGTGDLIIRGTEVRLKSNVDNDDMITCIENGATNLFYSNAKKLETTSGGISVTGTITASSNITAYSSKKLKSDIETIDNALDKVSQMRGVTFTKDNEKSSGVIAEELEEVAPELVIDGEYKSVAYGNIVGYLIEAIKDLKNEVEELKTKKLCKCED